jgi:hypothetical protein
MISRRQKETVVHRSGFRFIRWFGMLVWAFAGLASAQQDATFSNQRLDQLTAQVALYPDALLSQVLMASTYPADVAQAAAWSRAHAESKGDEAVKMVENEPWDPSVQSLVAFPQVIIMMGEKPDWVRDLGDAFLAQPDDVMDSVQRLRLQAQKAGNLKSNEQQTVTVEPAPPSAPTAVTQPAPQVIVIQPAQPQVIYVPQYNPMYAFGAWGYPAYPPYFIPPPPGYWFSAAITTGIVWGVSIGVRNALWGGTNWGHGYGGVNINVNRYNNINVNNRLNVNSGNTNWNHNVQNRRDVPYRGGDATRKNLDNKYQAGNREQYRGRDDSRQKAAQSMQDRGMNVDKSAARDTAKNVDRSAAADRAKNVDRSAAADRAKDVDRSAAADRAKNVDRSAAADRAKNVDRGAAADRAKNVDQNAARERAQTADRSAMQTKAQTANRDNALRGAGDPNAKQQTDRGAASRQAMQPKAQPAQRPAAGGGGGGGKYSQPQGGGGNSKAQRPAGGGAAARHR